MGWAKKLVAAGVLLVGAKLALAGGAGEALAGMVNEALGGRMVSASIDLELGPRAAEETAPASDPVYPSIVLDPSPSRRGRGGRKHRRDDDIQRPLH